MALSRYAVVQLPKGARTRSSDKFSRPGSELEMVMRGGSDQLREPSDAGVESPSVQVAEMRREEAEDVRRADGTLVLPAMPLTLVRPDPAASDDALADQEDGPCTWGVEAVGASQSRYDGRKVRVAVLDSGIDLEHVAFVRLRDEERIVWRNFTSGPKDEVRDVSGHGTHCAGTICGGEVDGVRIGVAPGLDRLIVGKVLGPGGGTTDVVVQGLLWAVEERADIISMSLGIDFPGWVAALVEDRDLGVAEATSVALEDYRDTLDAYRELTDFLRLRKVLVVAATGNESERPKYTINVAPPAAADRILSVGALERRAAGLRVATFSNTRPEIAAPGVNIRSAKLGGGLTSKNGTSMAAPHVAGVAALWCQKLREDRGELTRDLLSSKLIGTATLEPFEPDFRAPRDVGVGLVQAP
jgi:subtilisin family serine protease